MISVDEQPQGILVILEDAGSKKIAVIREIRAMTGLGLKAAKTATERAPSCVRVVGSSYEAEQAVERLRSAGAKASAVSPDSLLAQRATPLADFEDLSRPAAPSAGGGFYRFGFWALLLVVLYLWLRSA